MDDQRHSPPSGRSVRSARPTGSSGVPPKPAGQTGPPRGVVPLQKKSVTASPPKAESGGKELSIIGNFPNPYKTRAEEIAALNAGRWQPSSDDFAAVAGPQAITAENFGQFVGAILREKPGSIKRVNLFTHADRGWIAFNGYIRLTPTMAEVRMYTEKALSFEMLEKYASASTLKMPETGQTYNLEDLRNRFAKDAEIVLYACHSGSAQDLLAGLADAFKVNVTGFSNSIRHDSILTNTGPRSARVADGGGPADSDFHKLKGDRHARPSKDSEDESGNE